VTSRSLAALVGLAWAAGAMFGAGANQWLGYWRKHRRASLDAALASDFTEADDAWLDHHGIEP
jgi:hypothetical protein